MVFKGNIAFEMTSFDMESNGIVYMTGNQYINETALDNNIFHISIMCDLKIFNISFQVSHHFC